MSINNTAVSEVLTLISDGQWHKIYSIHKQYRLNPVQVLEVLEYLQGKGIVEYENDKLRLIPVVDASIFKEIRLILNHRYSDIEGDEVRFGKPKLSINQLYMPIFKLLDKSLITATDKTISDIE